MHKRKCPVNYINILINSLFEELFLQLLSFLRICPLDVQIQNWVLAIGFFTFAKTRNGFVVRNRRFRYNE